MCGIVAFITNYRNGFDQSQIKAFQEMLYVNALRGTDSTGIFYVNNKEDVQIHKDVSESGPFLKSKEWDSSQSELYRGGLAVIGHCRAKTRGAAKDENAHPFNVDNKIILVHNGTFVGEHKHLADTEVDSHAIAHVLAEEKNIAKALNRINAAYALIWYNVESKCLHAIRNKERPLYYAKTTDGAMLLASESSFIYLACWRNGITLEKGGAQMLPEHQLLTIELEQAHAREYEFDDIDAGYKYQTRYPVQEVVPIKEAIGGKVGAMTPTQLAAWRGKSRYTMLEAAHELGLGDYETKSGEHFRNWLSRGEEIVVEAVDYFKVDGSDAKDTNYFIFGKVLSQNEKVDSFLVCWEIIAKDEQEVVQYVGSAFPYFNAKVEHGLYREWSLGGKPDGVTALFKVSDVEQCTNIPVSHLEN
jgi:predicted glutamine amidotransferase